MSTTLESPKPRGRKPGPKPSRTNIITVRVTPEAQAAAEKVAALTNRSISGLMEYALRLYIQKNYPLAFDPSARMVLRLEEAPVEGAAS